MKERYFTELAASYVRGYARIHGVPSIPEELLNKQLWELSDKEREYLFNEGIAAGLKLYRFKNKHTELPRVKRVLGFLRGISFESLLDVGSGRGVFLFPFLEAFPYVNVSCSDILDYRADFLRELAYGGVDRLSVYQTDICSSAFAENTFDVVCMLEVLEHIPDVAAAVRAAVRAAKKFVVVSVPSKEDDNPEHIHLLSRARLTELFSAEGCTALSFDNVSGHLIMVCNVGGKE